MTTIRPSQRAKTSSSAGPDDRLRRREAGTIDVRGVAAQQQHAVAPELGQARHVGRRAVDRRLVELVVAGDEHRAELGAQRDRARVGDRVGHVHELEPERAELDGVAVVEALELDVAQLVLLELGAGKGQGQRAAVDRRGVARRRARAAPRAARRRGPRGRG